MKLFHIKPVTKIECAGEHEKQRPCPNFNNGDPINLIDKVGKFEKPYCPKCIGSVKKIHEWNYSAIAFYAAVGLLGAGVIIVLMKPPLPPPPPPECLTPPCTTPTPSPTPIPTPTQSVTPTETPSPTPTPTPNDKLSQAEEFAQIAIDLIKDPKNVTALEQAKTSFEKAINNLESIPDNVGLTVEVQKRLSDYKTQLAELNKRIAEEQKAQQLLTEAKSIAEKADKLSEDYKQGIPKLISENIKIRGQYDQALRKVEKIVSEYPQSLVTEEAKNLISNYKNKIGRIDNEIDRIKGICGESSNGIGYTGTCEKPKQNN